MNFKRFSSIGIMIAVLFVQTSFAKQSQLVFKNQRGSILEINFLDNNKVEGYFTTAVASKTCPQAIGKKRPISGYFTGNAITFTVVYPMCGSVLSVTGNVDQTQKSIDTLSILNKQASDVTHEGPGARFIGHDFYERIT